MGGPMIETINEVKERKTKKVIGYIIQLGFDGYDSELKNPRDKMFE